MEWDKEILGPIRDTLGVEQGACASDRMYRLANNEQLDTAQQSELGVDLGLAVTTTGEVIRQILSAVGLADDVGLLSNDMNKLAILLHLTKIYCAKYQVKLVASKTKLLVFTNRKTEVQALTELAVNTVSLDGVKLSPSSEATHVGVVRSSLGNGPNIAARLTAHRRAVYGVLHLGLAKGHRANPYASLRVETVFGVSVLLSGLASLVLNRSEAKNA